MEIRSSLEGLKSLLGVNHASAACCRRARRLRLHRAARFSADRATLSSAASEVAQSASDDGVRMDKVASIQAALASWHL